MIKIKDFHDIEELFNKNRMLLNVLIGYCRHDVEKAVEISNVLQVLEILSENENKIKNLIDNSCEKMMQN